MKESKQKVLPDERIVEAFWKIVEPDKIVRLNNVELIINELALKKGSFNDQDTFPDLEYSLKRLITGLASCRKAARQGFSVTLTELLRTFPSLDPHHIISLIFKLVPVSNTTGERQSSVIGQSLAFTSLIRSGKLNEHPTSLPIVVETVLRLSSQKPYIEHACCLALQELLNQISSQSFSEYVWPILEPKLSSGWEKSTPQELWLLLISLELFPEIINTTFLSKYWGGDQLYSKENYQFFGKIIKKSTLVHPRTHPVCLEIVRQISLLKKRQFKEFWKIAVEDTLLGLNQFQEAYLVFELVKLTLPRLTKAKQVMYVLSPELRELVIRSVKFQHSPLHLAATQLCAFLVEYAGGTSDPSIQIAVLKAFITPPGSLLFDTQSRQHFVQNLIMKLKFEAVSEFSELLLDILGHKAVSEDDEPLNETQMCLATSQLSRLTGHPLAEVEWKSQILQQLFLHGFFKIQRNTEEVPWCAGKVYLSAKSREACRKSFLHALELLQAPAVKKSYQGRLDHQMNVLLPVVEYAHLLLNSPEIVKPLQDVVPMIDSWNSLYDMMHKLHKRSAKDGKQQESTTFQIFYLQLSFQLFYDFSSAEKILSELNECCKRSLKARRHASHNKEDLDPDEPFWADVVLDMMLSMLSYKSHYMRSVVNSVFPSLCPFLTSDSMRHLLEVIQPSSGESALSVENEDDEELEFESGSSSDSEDEAVNGHIDEDFREQLRSALGNAAENSEEEETYLSDSDMMKLDEAISKAFVSRVKPSKKDKAKDEEAQSVFRMRCLDLLAIYVKGKPSLRLTLLVTESLVNTMKQGLNNQKLESVSSKSCNILKNIATIKKFSDTADVKLEDLQSLLTFLVMTLQKAGNYKFQQVLIQLSSFTAFHSQALIKSGKDNNQKKKHAKWYLQLCKEHLSHYFEKSTSDLSLQLFDHLIFACGDYVWEFLDILQVAAFQTSTRLFKRTRAFELLGSAIKKIDNHSQDKEDKAKLKEYCGTLIPKATLAVKQILELGIKPTSTQMLLDLVLIILQSQGKVSNEQNSIQRSELVNALNGIHAKNLNQKGRKEKRKIQALLERENVSGKKKRKTNGDCSKEIPLIK